MKKKIFAAIIYLLLVDFSIKAQDVPNKYIIVPKAVAVYLQNRISKINPYIMCDDTMKTVGGRWIISYSNFNYFDTISKRKVAFKTEILPNDSIIAVHTYTIR